MAVCLYDRFPVHLGWFADFAHHQGLDFGPFAMQKGHESPIDTQHEFVRPRRNFRPVTLDPLDLCVLHRFIGQANRLGMPLGGRLTDRDVGKAGQHLCRVSKGHPAPEMYQVIL